MNFIKTYLAVLVIVFVFVFFGGGTLFDFQDHFYMALAAISLIIAVITYLFVRQEERIDALEDRIKKLEKEDIQPEQTVEKHDNQK